MVATADNEFKLLVNGRPALRGDDWNRLYRADITALLHPGRNVLAVEGINQVEPAWDSAVLGVSGGGVPGMITAHLRHQGPALNLEDLGFRVARTP